MVSFRGSLIAGVLIGVAQSLIRFNIDQPGIVEFVLLGAILDRRVLAGARRGAGRLGAGLAADVATDPRAGEGDLVGALDADRRVRRARSPPRPCCR